MFQLSLVHNKGTKQAIESLSNTPNYTKSVTQDQIHIFS